MRIRVVLSSLLFAGLGLLLLAACGTSDLEDTVTSSAAVAEPAAQDAAEDADHADEDHYDEEDHDDEDADHADEDHDDDDHDEHGDEDHDDDDHDEHGDEDHDDEDHDDHSESGLAAHEHGAAELFVAWTDDSMVVDLVSPAFNIYGFEYEPQTNDEQTLAADQNEVLANSPLLVINEDAGCTLTEPVEPDFVVEGSHAEVTTSWLYECADPAAIREIDASALFEAFPAIVDLDAQWASASAQSASELTPSSPVLSLG